MERPAAKLFKFGGSMLEEDMERVLAVLRKNEGSKILLVFGYSRLMKRLLSEWNLMVERYESPSGVASYKIDEKVLNCSLAAASLQQYRLLHLLNKSHLNAIAVTGLDGKLVQGRKKYPRFFEKNGCLMKHKDDFSGVIERVDVEGFANLLQRFDIVCVGPVLHSDQSPLVCDADAMATAIASAWSICEWTLFTDVEGVIYEGTLIRRIYIHEMPTYIKGCAGGMRKKLKIIKNNLHTPGVRIVITNMDNYLEKNGRCTQIVRKDDLYEGSSDR